jgi:hypothetical protein
MINRRTFLAGLAGLAGLAAVVGRQADATCRDCRPGDHVTLHYVPGRRCWVCVSGTAGCQWEDQICGVDCEDTSRDPV